VHLAAAAAFFVAWLRVEEARGLRETAATLALLLVIVMAVPGCRPRDNPRLGGDSTRTAGPPEMAQDSLAAGRAGRGSGFTRVGSIVGLSGPESFCYDPGQDVYFISNFNGTLTAKDNNGFISRVRPDGRIDSLKFIAGGHDGVTLNAPTGMASVADTLWVADVSALRAFDAPTGRAIATVDLSRFHPHLLNDVALGPDHALYITDTGIHLAGDGAIEHPGPDRVFRVGPDRRPSVALARGIEGPNGVAWDSAGRRFLVVSFTGKHIYGWTPGQRRAQAVAQGPGRFDGVVSLQGGRALVSSWADSSVYLLHGDSLARTISGLPQPADIGMDPRRHRLGIPVSSENRVELWLVPGD
jgi:sugar lactone lactonase YvrE